MYRQNEAGLVGGVLERKLAGDATGAVDAAVKLWRVPEERPSEIDDAHAEVWQALVAMNVLPAALDAALAAMRGGERLRLHAFIDIGEATTDPAIQLELAKLALDHRWDPETYLAAALLRLVEANREADVLAFIVANTHALAQTTETWATIAAILTTTRVGRRADLASWFADWWEHDGVPMWVVQAYAATLMEPNPRAFDEIVAIAVKALDNAAFDLTAGYFAGVLAMEDLHEGRDAEFRARMTEYGDPLTALVALDPLSHPATRFHNRVRHAHPIVAEDLRYRGPDGAAVLMAGTVPFVGVAVLAVDAATSAKKPFNYKCGQLLDTLTKSPVLMERALRLFVDIYDLERGSSKVVELCVAMRKTRPSELPWLKVPWERLVKARTTWLTRLRLALA